MCKRMTLRNQEQGKAPREGRNELWAARRGKVIAIECHKSVGGQRHQEAVHKGHYTNVVSIFQTSGMDFYKEGVINRWVSYEYLRFYRVTSDTVTSEYQLSELWFIVYDRFREESVSIRINDLDKVAHPLNWTWDIRQTSNWVYSVG